MDRDTVAKMSGLASRSLLERIKKKGKRTEKLCEVVRFFGSQEGDQEFCNMLYIMSGWGLSRIQKGAATLSITYKMLNRRM
jgi:hypothetical protein